MYIHICSHCVFMLFFSLDNVPFKVGIGKIMHFHGTWKLMVRQLVDTVCEQSFSLSGVCRKMKEVLHQLNIRLFTGPYHHPRWCRISSINNISCTSVRGTVLGCRFSCYRIRVADVWDVMDLHLRLFLLTFLIFTWILALAPKRNQKPMKTYISCWDWRRAIQAGNNYGRLHFDCSRQVGPANPKRFINDEGSIVQDWSFANMLRLTNTLLAEDTDKIYQHVIQSLQNQSKLFKVQDMYQEGSFWGSLLKARWCFAASFMTFFP